MFFELPPELDTYGHIGYFTKYIFKIMENQNQAFWLIFRIYLVQINCSSPIKLFTLLLDSVKDLENLNYLIGQNC